MTESTLSVRVLWHHPTKLEVVDKFKQGHSALAVRENFGEGNTRAITIKEVMHEYSLTEIDVLKIDIEASEQYLFSQNTEEWLPKVRMVIIELHDHFAPGCSRIFFDAVNKAFHTYRYTLCGENTIIENLDFHKS
ncbi:MAG: hypothetical protein EOO01_35960 [Chitinophagaceae bacterium]|nr:MAG: hypothetical protein EOO01_35960 [Chitinophagaceae bacterium]